MKHALTILPVVLLLMAGAAFGQSGRQPAVPYEPGQGPVTYTKQGNTTYGDDGSQATQSGNSFYDDKGVRHERTGNTTYGDDGSKAETIGDQTFIENANGDTARCEKIGDKTFCDDQ